MRNVDMNLGGAAGALEGLIDQHPQDLVLGFRAACHRFSSMNKVPLWASSSAPGLALMFRPLDCSMPNSSDFHALRRDRGRR